MLSEYLASPQNFTHVAQLRCFEEAFGVEVSALGHACLKLHGTYLLRL